MPGWLLTPDNVQPPTPTLLYIGEAAAWSAVAEDAFAERLCVDGHCRVAVIDVRGRGDCAIAYPRRGRFYFPDRILDEAYLTWFTLMLGKPLLGGQVYDTLRALDYLRSLPGAGGNVSLIGDGPHGVIALYAAALDPRTAGVALRQTVTDYRSLAVAERYTQPFGIYAYGVLREFDLPDVARAVGPRPVLLLNPVTALGEPAGAAAQDLLQECAERQRSKHRCECRSDAAHSSLGLGPGVIAYTCSASKWNACSSHDGHRRQIPTSLSGRNHAAEYPDAHASHQAR